MRLRQWLLRRDARRRRRQQAVLHQGHEVVGVGGGEEGAGAAGLACGGTAAEGWVVWRIWVCSTGAGDMLVKGAGSTTARGRVNKFAHPALPTKTPNSYTQLSTGTVSTSTQFNPWLPTSLPSSVRPHARPTCAHTPHLRPHAPPAPPAPPVPPAPRMLYRTTCEKSPLAMAALQGSKMGRAELAVQRNTLQGHGTWGSGRRPALLLAPGRTAGGAPHCCWRTTSKAGVSSSFTWCQVGMRCG